MSRIILLLALACSWSCSVHKPTKQVQQDLDGKITRNDLEKDFPWFRDHYKQYQVNDTTLAALEGKAKGLEVLVVLGTWCSDSKEHVPAFFKVADAMRFLSSQISIVAVDRKKRSATVDVQPLHIEYVPVFIVRKNGVEVGRIIETPKESIEKDLLQIIGSIK